MPFDELTPDCVIDALARVGFILSPQQVHIEARDERWVVHLPDQRLAWFAASDEGRRRLATERQVLRLLEDRCNFSAPRIQMEDPAGDFDVRLMVPGVADPWRVYTQVCNDVDLAVRIGAAVGEILAEQHLYVTEADVAGWLPTQPNWPESSQWIRERLYRVVDDPKLITDAETIISMYESVLISDADRALVHTDVGFHNLGIDPMTYSVNGISDYEGAAWADRHHDFRYLVFDFDRYELFDAALSVYEPAVGYRIERKRVLLYNAACAIMFLAYRADTPPQERSCGRTLAEDLGWTKHAIVQVLDR